MIKDSSMHKAGRDLKFVICPAYGTHHRQLSDHLQRSRSGSLFDKVVGGGGVGAGGGVAGWGTMIIINHDTAVQSDPPPAGIRIMNIFADVQNVLKIISSFERFRLQFLCITKQRDNNYYKYIAQVHISFSSFHRQIIFSSTMLRNIWGYVANIRMPIVNSIHL